MVVGNYVLVAIPGGNPRDACVVASWPAGSSGGGGGVTDHGELTGLGDDDHTQYLNVARHDLTARHPLGTVVPHESALNNLGDVNVPSPANKYYLQYDAATSKWVAAQGYEFGPEMPLWQNEADFFHWTTTLTGSATVLEKDYGTLRLKTGTTAGSTARGRGFGFGWIGYATMDLQWFVNMYARISSLGTQQWFKIDSDTSGDPTTYAIGWREDAAALKGIVHNGTSLYVIDLGVTLSQSAGYSLFLNFVHGSKVEWYVNGVKKGESTNIPTGLKNSNTYCVISVQNNAVVASAEVHLHQHSFIQRYV
jgi:hypothetical protein